MKTWGVESGNGEWGLNINDNNDNDNAMRTRWSICI